MILQTADFNQSRDRKGAGTASNLWTVSRRAGSEQWAEKNTGTAPSSSTVHNPQSTAHDLRFSQHFSCAKCGKSYDELTPHHYSFNNRLGWCQNCQGLGLKRDALKWDDGYHDFGWGKGTKATEAFIQSGTVDLACRQCKGERLQPLPRATRLGDEKHTYRISKLCNQPLGRVLKFFKTLRLDATSKRIAGELLNEITSRLQFLVDVGLDYLTLNRAAPTLSGGESQRIRLASQLGSGLTGVLYVLDEPTIGLHPRDNDRLIAALSKLRDLGNTLCIVEHDRDVIDHADRVLDFGPGAGDDGGNILANKSPKTIQRDKQSITGKYLAGKCAISIPSNRRPVTMDRCLTVVGATHHNLKNIDVSFPLGRFIAVTGVSGSGKSSLVSDILYNVMASRLHRAHTTPGAYEKITGLEHVDKVINVDQAPIGQSPSSNPATYTGLFDIMRELFAKLPEAKIRGYTINHFSFNRPGGRCEECTGLGQTCVEMHFLPDVWITCDACKGTRYKSETLEVRYRGKHIADVLNMRVSEALEHFSNVPKLRAILQTLADVGLGYMPLGQSSATLSGGEAQRVKLSAELARPQTGKTVYVLDEPTVGLHFEDLKKLLLVLHRLVDLGNTVICIEHNLDLIKTADWVIDLGPEAGELGGLLVAADTPENLVRKFANRKSAASLTATHLAPILKQGPYEKREAFSPQQADKQQQAIDAALTLPEEDAEVKMPWERDGKRWHLRECLANDGERPRWESDALEWLVDTIEKQANDSQSMIGRCPLPRQTHIVGGRGSDNNSRSTPGAPGHDSRPTAVTDWNHRSRIEIRTPGSKPIAWFCHILTRGNWLLDCTFRVGKRTINEKTLYDKLKLKKLDDRPELPIYGQWRRVKRKVRPEHDDIRIWIHDKREINTPAFRQFLKDAWNSYCTYLVKGSEQALVSEPWKTNGKQWHLAQKSITSRREIHWKPAVLTELIGRLSKIIPALEFDWNNKTAVMIRHPDAPIRWGRITTTSRYGLKIELGGGKSVVTPLKIDRLGLEPHITHGAANDHDLIAFTLQNMNQLDTIQLRQTLTEADKSIS